MSPRFLKLAIVLATAIVVVWLGLMFMTDRYGQPLAKAFDEPSNAVWQQCVDAINRASSVSLLDTFEMKGLGGTTWFSRNQAQADWEKIEDLGFSKQNTPSSYICQNYKTGSFLEVWPGRKIYRTKPYREMDRIGQPFESTESLLHYLRTHREQRCESLGTEALDGQQAGKIQVYINYNRHQGPVTVWYDPETKLPLRIRFEGEKESHERVMQTLDHFEWNVKIPAGTFTPTIEKDFVEEKVERRPTFPT